jgi:CDP-diacylglycerol--glycerol-3-phosphate 3-phosphatidyltransferase
MTPANLCTLSRIVLSPLFVILFLQGNRWSLVGATAVAILLEITDIADGALARRLDNVTEVGKLLDPFADRIARFSAFLAFFAHGERYCELWMLLVFFYRDAAVSFLRILAARNQVVLAARLSGKIKAWFQGIAILTTLGALLLAEFGLWIPLGLPWTVAEVSRVLCGIAAGYTIYSGLDYLRATKQYLRLGASD